MKQEVTTKKVFIRTLGCQMNVRDSEVICGLLRTENYELTTNPANADIVIFNTCSVRQHAEDKVWSEVGKFGKRNTHGAIRDTKPIIGIVGCMAQNYKEKIFERAPQVDFVVGPTDIDKIPRILKEFENAIHTTRCAILEKKIWETEGSARPDEIYRTGFYEDKEHAYVVISEGCSNFCSYCVVPFVRGPLKNRHYKDILKEIEEAVDRGITKITLLGQNVNAYIPNPKSQNSDDKPEICFIDLLRSVNKIEGLKEFSFITSHPKDTTLHVFRAMADLKKLKKYLHLPVQSGSDRILQLMNRGYTRKIYLDLADNYRRMVPKGALTTDIIVGYPTETEEDFQATQDLVKQVQFNAAYIFKYSVRPHTQAASLVDDVPVKEKERRHRIILELQKEISKHKK